MSAHFYPSGNKEKTISVWDDTPLLEYLEPFIALAMFRFDQSIDVHGGDYIIKKNQMLGLRMICESLYTCLCNWESFGNLNGVKK